MSIEKMVSFENNEKREIDFLKLSLKSMKKRFLVQKNFKRNSTLLFKELYKVLQYEDEYLIQTAFATYEAVRNIVKNQTFADNSGEIFLFTLDGFMQKFLKETSKLFD